MHRARTAQVPSKSPGEPLEWPTRYTTRWTLSDPPGEPLSDPPGDPAAIPPGDPQDPHQVTRSLPSIIPLRSRRVLVNFRRYNASQQHTLTTTWRMRWAPFKSPC